MKSARFHHEIHQISWPWNPSNFIMKSSGFHGHEIRRPCQMSQGPMVLFFFIQESKGHTNCYSICSNKCCSFTVFAFQVSINLSLLAMILSFTLYHKRDPTQVSLHSKVFVVYLPCELFNFLCIQSPEHHTWSNQNFAGRLNPLLRSRL